MRVMFVDDEIQVLKGIKRMLESANVDWEIETATSGADALATLENSPVDVLVSDMQMPGMNGAQLLEQISQRYPKTVRLVLSGQASKEAVFNAIAPMHQYLAKPCKAEVLRTTITRACALREMLEATESHEFLGQIKALPSLPTIYRQVVEEIESENGSIARVGELVSLDPAMTAKILQLANSALFGLRSTVTCPARAASLIGLEPLKALVLSLQVFKSFEGADLPGFSIDALASHSLLVGVAAQKIAKLEGLSNEIASEAFTAGLLHDIGKLILAANAPDKFAKTLADSTNKQQPQSEVEKQAFGLGHDGIGGYLLALWGLPQSIVESVAFHHQPEQSYGSEMSASAIVYIANFLTKTEAAKKEHEQQFQEVLAKLDVAEDRLDAWNEIVAGDVMGDSNG